MESVVHDTRVHEVIEDKACDAVERCDKVLEGVVSDPKPALYGSQYYNFHLVRRLW